jgi:uncharacterized YccA/Bax inhibitor family protein
MDNKLTKVGAVLFTFGILSFLLSLVNLQFKALSFLGEYKIYVEIASIVIGLIIMLVAKFGNKDKNGNEEQNN